MAETFLRFRGLKTDTWDVDPLVQIGPDVDRDTGAEIIRDTVDAIYSTTVVGGGDDAILTCPYDPTISDHSLSGKHLYSHYFDTWVSIVDNEAIGTFSIDIKINTSLDYSATPPLGGQGTLAEIYDEIIICVSKTGNDSNSGFPGSPKLTVQAAINACAANNSTKVVILDDGIYTERPDLKGVSLYAAAGRSPTIKFPVLPFSTSATGISVATYQLSEFTYNGSPCVYAAAHDGLYRSLDGIAWTKVLLSGNVLTGCCVWNGNLYAVSQTNGYVYKVDDAGMLTTFATAAASGTDSATVRGGIWAIGAYLFVSVGDDPIAAVWYDGAWHQSATGEELGKIKNIVYDPIVSTRYAFGRSDLGGLVLIDTQSSMGRSYYASIMPVWLASHDGALYAMTADGVSRMVSADYPDVWATVIERGPWWGHTLPKAMLWDSFGYVSFLTEDDVSISKDNMVSFDTYEYGGGLFSSILSFHGVEIVGKSVGIVAWDRRQMKSATAATVNGCIIDGNGLALDTYAGDISLVNCRARNGYQPADPTGHTATHQYMRFEDFMTSPFSGTAAAELVLDHCELARITDGGLRVAGQKVRIKDCTVAASHRGLVLDYAPLEATRSIFAGNVIDVESNVSGASLASCCYETATGYAVTNTVSGSLLSRYAGNPLFVDDSGADLRLKSRASGYPADSGLLANVEADPGEYDMRESIGARRYSRALTGSTFGVDYLAKINPSAISPAWQPASYQKSISSTGSIYGSETNAGAYKVAKKLAWNGQATSVEDAQLQAAWLRYIYSLDTVLDVGESTTGTDWVPRFTATKSAGSSFSTLAAGGTNGNPPNIAPNQYAGAWCEDENGDVIGRIVSHGAPVWDGVTYSQYVISAVWETGSLLPSASTTCKIDVFRRYRIDKSQAFAPSCQTPYAPGIIPEIPSQYDITLCEVDE